MNQLHNTNKTQAKNEEKKDNNNNISQSNNNNNNNNNKNSKQKQKLNDLVASIINQYTTAGADSLTASAPQPQPQPTAGVTELKNSNISIPLVATGQPAVTTTHTANQQQQNLLENLNNLVNSSQPAMLSKALSGLKVTVLGIEQPNTMKNMSPVISSVSSSPSSMSVMSTMSLSSTSDRQPNQSSSSTRPSLLELNKKSAGPVPIILPKQFNTAYINQNSKTVLEKSHKDLQRQTVALNKISNQFQDDLAKSQTLLNKSFNNLRQILNERQNQLQFKLNSLSQTGHDILDQRQVKAAQLKHLAENAIHLNDNETLELKADIKV